MLLMQVLTNERTESCNQAHGKQTSKTPENLKSRLTSTKSGSKLIGKIRIVTPKLTTPLEDWTLTAGDNKNWAHLV
jgi:hypothetical protein